jgi:hypothetical protein
MTINHFTATISRSHYIEKFNLMTERAKITRLDYVDNTINDLIRKLNPSNTPASCWFVLVRAGLW